MLSREKTKTDDQRQDVNDYPVKEQYVLSRLLPEYVSLYRIELNSGKYEILRLDANTNARQLAEKDPHPAENFDEYARRYADNFILDEEKEEFIDWHLCANMKRRLLHEEKLTYHYHSVSKEGKDSYYEAYVVKGKTEDETFDVFLGYRNIDSILYKEKEIQEKLRKTLDEARLGNEIISSIATEELSLSHILNAEGEAETDDIKKKGGWRLASIIPAVAAVIAFILTENMRLPMVLVDKWTLLMVIIALVQLLVAYFSKKKTQEPEQPEQMVANA